MRIDKVWFWWVGDSPYNWRTSEVLGSLTVLILLFPQQAFPAPHPYLYLKTTTASRDLKFLSVLSNLLADGRKMHENSENDLDGSPVIDQPWREDISMQEITLSSDTGHVRIRW